MKIKFDHWNWEDQDDDEQFDETGWTYLGGTYRSDSDAGSHGACTIIDAVNKGHTVITEVTVDEDRTDWYGRKE